MSATTSAVSGCLIWLLFAAASREGDLDRDKLVKQLETHEGRKAKVYMDTAGNPTIGVGFNLNKVDAKMRIERLGLDFAKIKTGKQELTEAQINKLLGEDIDTAVTDCQALFPKFADLSDVRQRVLADMMFNLGRTKFEEFKKMIENIKAEKFAAAADEMKASKWYKQVKARGKTLEAMMRTDKDPQ